MALKLKYTDEHGILQINMSPSNNSPVHTVDSSNQPETESDKTDIHDPKFDTINNRFGSYDLFGGKYDDSGDDVETRSLFRSRYNSIEQELANTPYAFATERSLRFSTSPLLDITIERGTDVSPSKDIEDDRFFNRKIDLFGPQIDLQQKSSDEDLLDTPAFTVTQLIHAQDRYFDLSSRQSSQLSVFDKTKSEFENKNKIKTSEFIPSDKNTSEFKPSERKTSEKVVRSGSGRTIREDLPSVLKVGALGGLAGAKDEAFKVLSAQTAVKAVQVEPTTVQAPVVPTSKRKREKSFAILTEAPVSRPSSPRSLPVEIRSGRVSPFRGRGFREETSRHTTPRTSTSNSRANSPPRRRTSSLSRIDSMATATLPPPLPPILPPVQLSHSPTPRDFVKENIEEVREISELNREKHEAEAEQKQLEEDEALLKEMGLLDKNAKLDKNDAIRSVVCSRANSRSNSPSKIKLRSRSNSPSAMTPSTILRHDNEKRFINQNDGMAPVPHRSRVRSVSKSQPQSNDGSPKHSKIPKRQNSVSPHRNKVTGPKRMENGLKNQRFISNSTSSIHETIRLGSQAHDRRAMSKSTQLLNIAPAHIKGKPPISPGRGGPPPSNRAINAKRLSPIVGTPNKSPTEDKSISSRTPTKPISTTRKQVKPAGTTPATSRLNSRQPSRATSRDPSPNKRLNSKPATAKPPVNSRNKPVARSVSSKSPQKPVMNKVEPKKPVSRTASMKSLTRTISLSKNLNEKPPPLPKRDSKKDLKTLANLTKLTQKSAGKSRENIAAAQPAEEKKSPIKVNKTKYEQDKIEKVEETKKVANSSTEDSTVTTQDNETQYDKVTNEKGDLVIMTKKNIVSMTTAAITSQPLEVVTKVTNQLPTTLEKAREKGMFERHSSKDSLAPKEDDKKETKEDDDKKKASTVFTESNVRLKPLLPPYNNPQVERVKQKIDDILRTPEVSTENIAAANSKAKETKNTFKNIADKTKADIQDAKDETTKKFTDIKDQVAQQEKAAVEKANEVITNAEKAAEKTADEIRSEASKIVDSIMTPIEEPKTPEPLKEAKKDIEPIVMVVNEKKNVPSKSEIVERMTETLVKGEPEVEVQSSNLSTEGMDKMAAQNKMADGSGSDKSATSNGGFPQSTSTTPKPPARLKKDQKNDPKTTDSKEQTPDPKPPTRGQKLLDKCKKCCACCGKPEDDEKEMQDESKQEGKRGFMSKFNCCRRKEKEERDAEKAAGKAASIEFESETKHKRKLRDVMCGCCGRRRRVSDVSVPPRDVTHDVTAPAVGDTGCCGRKKVGERRDSILSERPDTTCCNNRVFNWFRGCCRREQQPPVSRRQSLFSKNKSLSPTLPPELRKSSSKKSISSIMESNLSRMTSSVFPTVEAESLSLTPRPSPRPKKKKEYVNTDFMKKDTDIEEDVEDTRTKLDPSLVEHTSLIRGAVPVLPLVLAYFCLFCNIIVPGLGTIFSGMFCLCFGIPRFGVHDGAKYRIGSFIINLVVGCGQLFTVLFCLVGWGWSIWWGVIMVKTSRKYRKLKAEAAEQEAEAPPVTANNHTRA